MVARVSFERFPREQHEAGVRIVIEELLPALRRAPGYQGCYVLADGRPGTLLLVMHWETEEAADAASAERGVTVAFVKLVALGLKIESRQLYEVLAQDVPGAQLGPFDPSPA